MVDDRGGRGAGSAVIAAIGLGGDPAVAVVDVLSGPIGHAGRRRAVVDVVVNPRNMNVADGHRIAGIQFRHELAVPVAIWGRTWQILFTDDSRRRTLDAVRTGGVC